MDSPNPYNRRNLELRAAEYFVSIRKPENEWQTIEDLAPQLVEFAHRIQAQDCDAACELLNQIDYGYLFRWGDYRGLVQRRQQLAECLTDVRLQALNYDRWGFALQMLGQAREALHFYETALSLVKKSGDARLRCPLLTHLGNAHRNLGQLDQAQQYYQEALELARTFQLVEQEGVILGNLGNAYHYLGSFEEAIDCYLRSLAFHRQFNDQRRVGNVLADLGATYRALQRHQEALLYYQEALVVARDLNDTLTESNILGGLGIIYRDLGRFQDAWVVSQQALQIAQTIQARRFEGLHQGRLGIIQQCLGQFAIARTYYSQALSIAQELDDVRYARAWCYYLGTLHYTLGEFDAALGLHRQALATRHSGEGKDSQGIHLVALGKVLVARNELTAAQACIEEALTLNHPMQHQALLWRGIIEVLQENKDGSQWLEAAGQACAAILAHADLYTVQYTLAAVRVGQAVGASSWTDITKRPDLLAPVLPEYRYALEITSAPGIVREALRDLELIRASGIEDLEPVFALLEEALNDNTPPSEESPDSITV